MSYAPPHSAYSTGTGGYGSNYGSNAGYNSNWASGPGQYNAYRPALPQSNTDRYNPYGGARGQPPPPGMEYNNMNRSHHFLNQPAPPPPAPIKRPAFKLRRSIQPRPMLSVLHELAGSEKPIFDYYDVPMVERERRAWVNDIPVEEVGEYECKCIIGELEFVAEGQTKPEARVAVAEVTVQGLIAHKCELNDIEGVGASEDNCPWAAIASLALHKLYMDWQSQGYTIPEELINLPDSGPVFQSHGIGFNRAPSNPVELDKNPLQKLNEMAAKMKKTPEFELTGEEGTPNEKVFTMQVKIGDRTYTGEGKNKKAARHAAASTALEDRDNWYLESAGLVEELQQQQMVGGGEGAGGEGGVEVPPEKGINLEMMEGIGQAGMLPGSHPGNVTA